MNRVLLVFVVVFAFAARSDGLLKCYVCDSLMNPSCGDSSKEGYSQPVECNIQTMNKWHDEVLRNHDFRQIASIFEVDHDPQHATHLADVACAKMNLKLGSRNVTIRSCQSAKTATVDTCGAIRNKLAKDHGNIDSLGYCGLCYTDACNGAMNVVPAPNILQLIFGAIGLMVLQGFRYSLA